ncbi:MAG: hypothetical protein R2850_07550 [Bacteroidia bacterium]
MKVPDLLEEPSGLSLYFTDKQILRSLVLQLNKDLASAAVPLKFLLSARYSFSDMQNLLSDKLSKIPVQQVFNLLYRVDISEQQLMRGMPTPGVDLDLFSALIIKRELQKVVLRKLYSSQTDDFMQDSEEGDR